MPEGRHSASRGPSDRSDEARRRERSPTTAPGGARRGGRQGLGRSSGARRGTSCAAATGARWIITGVVIVGLVAVLVGGGYLYAQWRFDQIPKQKVRAGSPDPEPNQPFNILAIGSDSRAGLTGAVAKQTGASTGSVSGQRSDVVKIFHVDPGDGHDQRPVDPARHDRDAAREPEPLRQVQPHQRQLRERPVAARPDHQANFGIPINHVIQVGFAGLVNAADALGGVYLDFPYPVADP